MRRSNQSQLCMTALVALALILGACVEKSTPPATPTAVCGDGIIAATELCDWTATTHLVGSNTCASATGNPMSVGTLGCAEGCQTFNTSACAVPTNTQPPATGCGDGIIQAPEQCENMNGIARFNPGDNCASVTMGQMDVGALGCSATCQYDLSMCRSSGGAGGTAAMGAGGMGAGGTGGQQGGTGG